MKHQTILQTIGNTPTVELRRYSRKGIRILAKLEGNNPGGSIKDRIALFTLLDARRRGILSSVKEIIEPTSGNTGIGLAMLSAVFGYKFVAVMPESVSIERRKLLEAYGAKIILTDGGKGTNYAINVLAHYKTTGAEIIRDVPEVTHFVAGMGTGGTLMGGWQKTKRIRSQNSGNRH